MTVNTPERDWTDGRIGDFSNKVDSGFKQVAKRFEKVDERFDWVDKRFDKVDERFDKVDERFEKVDAGFARLDDKIDRKFDRLTGWLIGLGSVIIAGLLGIIGSLAHVHIW